MFAWLDSKRRREVRGECDEVRAAEGERAGHLRTRAAENRVYLLAANRVGKEREGEFCGWSQIVDPYGVRLAEAGADEKALLVADVDVERAHDKDYVVPGEYELYLFGHRRPELYGVLIEETVRA